MLRGVLKPPQPPSKHAPAFWTANDPFWFKGPGTLFSE